MANELPKNFEEFLRLLEQDGMVERETDSKDRRKTLVRITPAGMEALRGCEDALNAYFARVMARLGAKVVSV